MSRLVNSFKYAFQGLLTYFRSGGNVTIHLIATVIVIVLAWLLEVTPLEWCILVICISIVLAAEAFNTAIEKLVDMVQPEYDKKAGEIKDIAAAAVLIVAIMAAVVGVVILGGKML